MTSIDTSLLAIISGTIAVLCVYIYLYLQYREPFMGLWILSWLFHLFRTIFFQMPRLVEVDVPFQLAFQILSGCSSLFLIWGTSVFINKGIKRVWLYGAILSAIISDLAVVFDQTFVYKALPTCIFIGSIYIWTGMALIRHLNIRGLGKYITGGAFVLLGIHAIDFIFFADIAWFAPWGYLVDAALRFIIAVGTLLIYFEKTRYDLSNKEKYYRLFTENAVDIIYRYQIVPERSFEYISPAVTAITGYSPEDFYNDPALVFRMIHPNDAAIYENIEESIRIPGSVVTVRLFCKDHKEIWIEQKCKPTYGEGGELIAIEGIVRDVTVRKMFEQNLARLDSLNTVGQMAASVAHEVRNPMTSVRGYLQLLSNRREFISYKEQFEFLIEELDQSNAIISEYLSLSQNRAMDFKNCQLNQIIEALYPLLQADAIRINKCINLDLKEIPQLYLDGKEIRQLIVNLVRNGLESMSAGRTVTIRTFLYHGETVLAIKDEGEGIAQHILDNLGKPFVTTKKEGTGIGLAICYRIANRHNANITVETNASGTTFFIHFKVSQKVDASSQRTAG